MIRREISEELGDGVGAVSSVLAAFIAYDKISKDELRHCAEQLVGLYNFLMNVLGAKRIVCQDTMVEDLIAEIERRATTLPPECRDLKF